MYSMQRLTLLLLTCLFMNTLTAQTSIKINITGVDKTLEDNIRLYLSMEQQKNSPLLTEGRLLRLHKKATKEIQNALQPFGYYRPQIHSTLIKTDQEQWQASYEINPGQAILISQFNFSVSDEIQKDPEFKTLASQLPLKNGDIFNHVTYENFKSTLSRFASERGYPDARFTQHSVEINLDTYEVKVSLRYESGARFKFGDVIFSQNILDPELLDRYLSFDSGDPYDLNELINLQQALNDSDYFSTVEVSPQQPLTDYEEIPVTVALTPRKDNRYTFGLGYGTDTGIRTKFGWEMPRVNSRGHRFDSEIKVAETGYSITAHYRVPVLNPRTDQMIYSSGIVNETTDTSESTVRTVGTSLNRSHAGWRESVSLNYQQEDYIIAGAEDSSTLLLPGVNWSRTWAENIIYTTDGLRLDIGLRGSSTDLLSDTTFTQLQTGIKVILSLNSNNRLITRANFGATWTDEFDQLPSSVRFFTGGSQSVRGYAYQSLGPLNSDGEVIGGQYLIVGSIEVEHKLSNNWGAALFYDTGNAMDNLDDSLEAGAGFGFRWKSPVGMVRIDIASAVTQEGEPWRLHINIGPDL